MKYDGICEINQGVSKTSQVYVSNYGLIKSMLASPRVRMPIKEYTDEVADEESKYNDGSIYSQGVDDVSFNMQQLGDNLQYIKTNDFAPKSAVDPQSKVVEKGVNGDDTGVKESNS